MVGVFVSRKGYAGLTGHSGPGWARTGLARRCRCQPSASKDRRTRPKTAKRQPRTAKCCQFVEVFCYLSGDLHECANCLHSQTESIFAGCWDGRIPSHSQHFPKLVCWPGPMYAFPILLNIGVAFGVLWDSKASKNEHKTAWGLKEWHVRVTFVGGMGTLRDPRWPRDSFCTSGGSPRCPFGMFLVAISLSSCADFAWIVTSVLRWITDSVNELT